MDYFNDDERARQRTFASIRDRMFAPLTNLLAGHDVTPNQISAAGVAFLILAGLMPPSQAGLATLFMAVYVLCDGLDGPIRAACWWTSWPTSSGSSSSRPRPYII
jgi:hypothetical protein